VRIPVWLTFAIAAIVIIFGVYRIHLGLHRTPEQEAKAKERGGLYAMGKRTHLLVGIVYILLGAGLTATAFGWNPFGKPIGPSTEKPAADKAPAKLVPADPTPQNK
jgi:hypothetical protein